MSEFMTNGTDQSEAQGNVCTSLIPDCAELRVR